MGLRKAAYESEVRIKPRGERGPAAEDSNKLNFYA